VGLHTADSEGVPFDCSTTKSVSRQTRNFFHWRPLALKNGLTLPQLYEREVARIRQNWVRFEQKWAAYSSAPCHSSEVHARFVFTNQTNPREAQLQKEEIRRRLK